MYPTSGMSRWAAKTCWIGKYLYKHICYYGFTELYLEIIIAISVTHLQNYRIIVTVIEFAVRQRVNDVLYKRY